MPASRTQIIAQWIGFITGAVLGAEEGAKGQTKAGASKLATVVGGIEGATSAGAILPPPNTTTEKTITAVNGIVALLKAQGLLGPH